ncbi:MAG: metal-dependent hydrolase [Candidatus Jordarchaeum sp.]|uniref:metal-dependent hydrolase n=1 Tax=Candidatus Jordarchaeum sp. TaxID=2823881 RepID=UPI004049E5CD
MQKYTHLVVGATAGAIVAVLLGLNVDIVTQFAVVTGQVAKWGSLNTVVSAANQKLPPILAGAAFGILPDLDQLLKRQRIGHRSGLFHSVLTFIWLPVLIGLIAPSLFALSAAGIFSHWFIDSFNPSGVRTFPYILPRKDESLKDFIWKYRRDLRIATIHYDNHWLNIAVCGVCIVIIGLLTGVMPPVNTLPLPF